MKAICWWISCGFILAWLACLPAQVQGQGRVQAARAAAEFVIERFGGSAAREGVGALSVRIEAMAVRHGDEVFQAVRQVGPRFFPLVESAGANGGKAVRILAQHGEAGATWVLSRPRAMQLFLQHGEEAAAVLVRHPGGIAEPMIEQFGPAAVKALQAVGPQGGRRLGMMLADGELARIGRTPELLDVIFRTGERGMEFVWNNKGALCVSTALVAFLADPEAFISGARDISQIAAENAIRPLADIPGDVAREAAKKINWNMFSVASLVTGSVVLVVVIVSLSFRRKPSAAGIGGSGNGETSRRPVLPAAKLRASIDSPKTSNKPRILPPSTRRGDAANER